MQSQKHQPKCKQDACSLTCASLTFLIKTDCLLRLNSMWSHPTQPTQQSCDSGCNKQAARWYCTCDWVGGVRHKGVLGGNDRLAQHSHLELVMLQSRLAQAGHRPGVPFRCPHCLDGMPHVFPGGLAGVPIQACRWGEGWMQTGARGGGGGEGQGPGGRVCSALAEWI